MGLTRSKNSRIEGSVKLDGEELTDAEERDPCAGSAASDRMIFQDPMKPRSTRSIRLAARSPRRSGRTARRHEKQARSGPSSCSRRSHPQPGAARDATRTNSPAACGSGDDRDGVALEPEVLIADEPTRRSTSRSRPES